MIWTVQDVLQCLLLLERTMMWTVQDVLHCLLLLERPIMWTVQDVLQLPTMAGKAHDVDSSVCAVERPTQERQSLLHLVQL